MDLIGKELMFFKATGMEEWDVCSSDRQAESAAIHPKTRLYGAILTAVQLQYISLSLCAVYFSVFLPQVIESYSQLISYISVPSGISMEIKLTSWDVIILLHIAGERGQARDPYRTW